MDIVIYGTGRCGQYVFSEIDQCEVRKVHIRGWIDNHTTLTSFHELPVMNEMDFIDSGMSVDAIVVAMLDTRAIQDVILSLLEQGYKLIYVVNNLIFRGKLPVLNEMGEFTSYVKTYDKIAPMFGRIQYSVADHCNLNCRGCGSFANISEPKFVSCEEFENDIRAMRKKIRNMSGFTFYGGEALLNPNLDSLIEIFKKIYPKVQVDIFSNGLLITKISEKLKKVIQENGVRFAITQYPPTIKMLPQIVGFLENNSIDYILEPPVEKFMRFFTKKEQDINLVYDKCLAVNDCKLLRRGRLYPCPQICFMHEKKDYLGLIFEDSERENCSFDLYGSAGNDWDMLLRLRKPFSMCRFCLLDHYDLPWRTGKSEKADWVED